MDGSQVFAPMVGFALNENTQGYSFFSSYLNVIDATDSERILTDELGNGIYRLNVKERSLKQTKKFPADDDLENLDELESKDSEDTGEVNIDALQAALLKTRKTDTRAANGIAAMKMVELSVNAA